MRVAFSGMAQRIRLIGDWAREAMARKGDTRASDELRGDRVLADVGALVRADGEADHVLRFRLNPEEVDRHGTIFSAPGWDLEPYRKNPTFLYCHNRREDKPPIGKALETWVADSALNQRVQFLTADPVLGDHGRFAEMIHELYRREFMRAVSVGFNPLEWTIDEELQAVRIIRAELLESSAVPVGSNRNALKEAERGLIEARAGGVDLAPMYDWTERALDGDASAELPEGVIEFRRSVEVVHAVLRGAGYGAGAVVAVPAAREVAAVADAPADGARAADPVVPAAASIPAAGQRLAGSAADMASEIERCLAACAAAVAACTDLERSQDFTGCAAACESAAAAADACGESCRAMAEADGPEAYLYKWIARMGALCADACRSCAASCRESKTAGARACRVACLDCASACSYCLLEEHGRGVLAGFARSAGARSDARALLDMADGWARKTEAPGAADAAVLGAARDMIAGVLGRLVPAVAPAAPAADVQRGACGCAGHGLGDAVREHAEPGGEDLSDEALERAIVAVMEREFRGMSGRVD